MVNATTTHFFHNVSKLLNFHLWAWSLIFLDILIAFLHVVLICILQPVSSHFVFILFYLTSSILNWVSWLMLNMGHSFRNTFDQLVPFIPSYNKRITWFICGKVALVVECWTVQQLFYLTQVVVTCSHEDFVCCSISIF